MDSSTLSMRAWDISLPKPDFTSLMSTSADLMKPHRDFLSRGSKMCPCIHLQLGEGERRAASNSPQQSICGAPAAPASTCPGKRNVLRPCLLPGKPNCLLFLTSPVDVLAQSPLPSGSNSACLYNPENKAVFNRTLVSLLGSRLVPDSTIWPSINPVHNPSPLDRLERIEGILQQHEEAVASSAAETRRAAEANEQAFVVLSEQLCWLSARLNLAAPPTPPLLMSGPVLLQQGPKRWVGWRTRTL
ncbi:uncharacterized protein [Takifugu rubripes]|uniref:uncharacterized protein n=1 Tax=Takifugu rubripes TaxID=31033 RepID=UPI001145FC19|nr:uncharacterized protein LOC115247187 [Takifugu rubripes]